LDNEKTRRVNAAAKRGKGTHGGAVGVRGNRGMGFGSAGALAGGGEFPELLLVTLDELAQRLR
jgi:hypothetical protein